MANLKIRSHDKAMIKNALLKFQILNLAHIQIGILIFFSNEILLMLPWMLISLTGQACEDPGGMPGWDEFLCKLNFPFSTCSHALRWLSTILATQVCRSEFRSLKCMQNHRYVSMCLKPQTTRIRTLETEKGEPPVPFRQRYQKDTLSQVSRRGPTPRLSTGLFPCSV